MAFCTPRPGCASDAPMLYIDPVLSPPLSLDRGVPISEHSFHQQSHFPSIKKCGLVSAGLDLGGVKPTPAGAKYEQRLYCIWNCPCVLSLSLTVKKLIFLNNFFPAHLLAGVQQQTRKKIPATDQAAFLKGRRGRLLLLLNTWYILRYCTMEGRGSWRSVKILSDG